MNLGTTGYDASQCPVWLLRYNGL